MSSAESSKLRRKEREWKPRMKGRGRKAAAPSSASSASSLAANAAISNLKDIGRRRELGQNLDHAFLSTLDNSRPSIATEKKPNQNAAPVVSAPSSRWAIPIAVAAGACLVLVTFTLMGTGWSRYSVSGLVMLEKQPLADAEIVFHPQAASLVSPIGKSSPEGSFQVTGLSPGTYKITLRVAEGSTVVIPMAYTKPESSPLRLNVRRNIDNYSMHVAQPKRR